MKPTALLLLGVTLSPMPSLAQYKCVTAAGETSFQQTPCPTGTSSQRLEIPEPPAPGSRDARVARAVASKTVFIGMTEAEVVRSWGRPKKINRSITERRTTEQWIYSGRQYLYLDNGVLRSIQTPD